MRRRGLTLIEGLISLMIACVTFFAFLTIFRTNYQHAAMTRNRAVAVMIARSLIAEVDAHPYGAPAPFEWGRAEEEPVLLTIAGNPVQMRFTKKIECENKSFIGGLSNHEEARHDVVKITVEWHENVGDAQGRKAREERKELVVRVPVWR